MFFLGGEGILRIPIKILWILATLVSLSGVIWFILGSTANFQRGIDLISTVILVYIVIPSIILIFLSVVLLIKKWDRPKWGTLWVLLMIFFMFSLTPTMYKYVNTSGWLTESVQSVELSKKVQFENTHIQKFRY